MKISVSAGHGKDTPGKRTPDGFKEFYFNKPTAEFLMEYLKEYEGVETLRLHDLDGEDIPLSKRSDVANKWKSRVHIDIHYNTLGSTWSSAEGIETFVYKTKPKEALILAANVQTELIRATGRKNRGVKYADFHMLRETDMTAILVECGFMSHKEEASLMKQESYQKKCAKAIADGLAKTYKLKKKEETKKKVHSSSSLYKVQVGAFSSKENAEALAKKLEKDGYNTYIVEE